MSMADIIDLGAWKGNLQSSKQGYKKNTTNLMMFLKNVRALGATIRWNEFAQRIDWNGALLEEHHLIDIKLILESADFECNDGQLLPAVARHARDNTYHPVRDYLISLEWDGTKRLDSWLQKCVGAKDTPFIRAVGRKTLIAAVARIMEPGCKVDTMLVLEGAQGLRKSSAVSELFGEDWTTESGSLFDQQKTMVMTMMGAWCIELAEFVAVLRSKGGPAAVKGLISTKVDRTVLSYAKMATDHPRQCVFIGTINPDDFGYLSDNTGNRRYWPVRCTKIDLDLIRARRDQMWAEAMHAFKAGEQWWLNDAEESSAREQVAQREETDVWEEILTHKLSTYTSTTITAALRAIGVPDDRMGKTERNRAAATLRQIGFVADEKPGKDENRKSVRVYRRAE